MSDISTMQFERLLSLGKRIPHFGEVLDGFVSSMELYASTQEASKTGDPRERDENFISLEDVLAVAIGRLENALVKSAWKAHQFRLEEAAHSIGVSAEEMKELLRKHDVHIHIRRKK